MREPCPGCLRRGRLIALLAPRIAAALGRLTRMPASLLSLPDDELIAGVAGAAARGAAERLLEGFDVAAERAVIAQAGTTAICRHQPAYPAPLLDLDDPPAVLYLSGAPERLRAALAQPAVAVVGSRRASAYGLEVAEELARQLATARVTIVSGLALGIDAAAHRGALAGEGSTLAVLAGGPDVPYPRTNRALHARVRASAGVISELPPGQRVLRWAFPARNRIMAGLAAMTLVVEAAEGSGSLITADFASDLGRDLGAVPGRITSRMAAGSNRLLKDGAVPVLSAEDVLDAIFGAGGARRRTVVVEDGEDEDEVPVIAGGAARPIRPGGASGRADAPTAADPLDPTLRRVLDEVEAGAPLDAIGRAADLRAGAVRAALGRLELLGLVRRDGFGGYLRTARP